MNHLHTFKLLHVGTALVFLIALAGCATTHRVQDAEFLGERSVDYRSDRDIIRVGERNGSYRAIVLRVERNDVDLRGITIHFENGSTQSIRFRRALRQGSETRRIDLDGGRRIIDRVELLYDTRGRRGPRGLLGLFGIR